MEKPGSLLLIRKAKEEDSATILQFVRDLAADMESLGGVNATADDFRRTLFGTNAQAEAIIGELDGKPVAFAVFFENYSTYEGRAGLYLDDLFVNPEYRSRGFGKKMLGYLASIALERGCPRFDWCVRKNNHKAFDFYRSLGALAKEDLTVHRLAGDSLRKLAEEYSS